jgi:DHA1 family bicyclomycin/chloramphenicol resistance-like MFS transporter
MRQDPHVERGRDFGDTEVLPIGLRLRGALLLTLGALAAFGPLSLDLYLPAFPSIADSLGVSTADMQVTFSACLVGLGLGQLLYGPLSDRYGRRPPLVVGLTLFVVASVLCALAPTLATLTVLRFLQGVGGCAGLVISRAIVRDLFSGPELARSFSVISSVSMLAPLVAPALGALVLQVANWRVMFAVIALLGLATLLAALRLPETLPPERRLRHGVRDAIRGYGRLAGQGRFVVPAIVVALASGTLMAYISSSSVVFMGQYAVPPGWFALIFGLMAACFIAGLRLNMALVRRFRVHALLRAYIVVEVPALIVLVALFALQAPLWSVLLALGIVKACLGGTLPNATAETMEPFARNAGSASALLGAVQMCYAGVLAGTLAAMTFSPSIEMSVAMLAMATVSLALAAFRRSASA